MAPIVSLKLRPDFAQVKTPKWNVKSTYMWSRGESNPRPNKAKAQFLHVYLVIDCRLKADHEQPTKQRSPVKFAPGVRPTVS